MTVAAIVKITVVALSLGIDVFAVCVGVGMRGTDRAIKIRIGAAFAFAEIAMTIVGAGIGHVAGSLLGEGAGYLGFAAITGVVAYMMFEAIRGGESAGFDLSRGWGLALGALSISLDSLGIGFSILYIGVPFPVSLAFIGVASLGATTLGLTLGSRLGATFEERAALFAGAVLVCTGLVFAGLKYFAIGG